MTGGGTAGHVFPAMEIARYLRDKKQCELHYIGNPSYIEQRVASDHGIPFHGIQSQGLDGNKVRFFVKNSTGVSQALRVLMKLKPDFLIATGGFVTAPVLAAAVLLKIPYALHEQNSVMGKVNRLFCSRATYCFSTFPQAEDYKHRNTGIPIRFESPLAENGERLVIVGGSGGSLSLNQFAVQFANAHPAIPVTLLAGASSTDVSDLPENLEVIGYTDDILLYYRQAKMVVSRSGAGTIFEMSRLAIPSILVPLPTSADDHQRKNALYFEEKDAAVLVEQREGFEHNLTEQVLSLWNDEDRRTQLKQQIALLGRTTCERDVGDLITQYVQHIKIS